MILYVSMTVDWRVIGGGVVVSTFTLFLLILLFFISENQNCQQAVANIHRIQMSTIDESLCK